ncbi:hypothetical protein ACNR9Q_14240 [Maribacter sp. X9]|uniref:hypothetical protein n=1 Tax=Maribacter sp. X9 TaxID=3402159 RepID=UPI003AF3943E
MQNSVKSILFLWFLISITVIKAQSRQKVTDSTKNLKITAFPVVFYLPETGLGYGGLGLSTFRLPGEVKETRPSSIQLGITLTTKKQFL